MTMMVEGSHAPGYAVPFHCLYEYTTTVQRARRLLLSAVAETRRPYQYHA